MNVQTIDPGLELRALRVTTETLLQSHAGGAGEAELALGVSALLAATESRGPELLAVLLRNLVERLILADAAMADVHLPTHLDGGQRLLAVVVRAARQAGLKTSMLSQLEALLSGDGTGRCAWHRLLPTVADGRPDPAAVALLPTELDLAPAVLAYLAQPWPASSVMDGGAVGDIGPWMLPPGRARLGSLHGVTRAVLGRAGGRVGDRYVLSLRTDQDVAALHPVVLREVDGVSDMVFPIAGATWASLDLFRERFGLYRIPLRLRPPGGRHRYVVILVPPEDVGDEAVPPRLAGIRRGVEEGRFGVEDFFVDVVDARQVTRRPRREARNAAVVGLKREEGGGWVSALAIPGQPVHRASVTSVEDCATRASALLELLVVKLRLGTSSAAARSAVETEIGRALTRMFAVTPTQESAWRTATAVAKPGALQLVWVDGLDAELKALPWELLAAPTEDTVGRPGGLFSVLRAVEAPAWWHQPLPAPQTVRHWDAGDAATDLYDGGPRMVLVAAVDSRESCAELLSACTAARSKPGLLVLDVRPAQVEPSALIDLSERLAATGISAIATPLRGCTGPACEHLVKTVLEGLGAGVSLVEAMHTAREALREFSPADVGDRWYDFAFFLGSGVPATTA